MPTVHLSLPDSVYNELKKRAAELGVQVTDIIKFYIKMGLNKGFAAESNEESTKTILALSRKLDKLEKDYRMKLTLLEGKYRQMEDAITYLIERVEILEETVMSLKAYSTIRTANKEG
ncbi:hypothetical protein apy_06130 [Aeropyrum pernix]|uniref:Uncharacterized protein n=1 Tax=Aeropyrum pernix TaxID=56636 RepID=A0A401H951_AERPX|nr:hypothetical protein [Aeropyrum pernix]GBF08888.1 hypothetical protein apy_06130 [Aeropyrum pernix]